MKYGYDLTRIKIGCRPHGFFDINSGYEFNEELRELDYEFYNCFGIYTDECLKVLCEDLEEMNMFQNIPYKTEYFSNEPFKTKMNLIKFIINNSNEIKKYDDTDRFFDYLNLKLMTEWERYKIHKHPFWRVINNEWEIINLILLEQEDQQALCYKMFDNDKKFIISPINYDEMDNYLENYNGKIKGIYRELTRK